MVKNIARKLIDLVDKIDQLPISDKQNIIMFVQNNECGLALDTLAHQLYENTVCITTDIYQEIIKLAQEMDINPGEFTFLKELIR